jgi:FlaA1/EpsC-like NDP-sugar epimerase
MTDWFFTVKDVMDRLIFYKNIRYLLIFFTYISLIVLGISLSLLLTFPEVSLELQSAPVVAAGIMGLSQLILSYAFRLNKGVWKYSSIFDLILIAKVAAVSFALNLILGIWLLDFSPSWRLGLVEHMFFILSFGGVRLAVRLYRNVDAPEPNQKVVLIVGAGDGGDIIYRHLKHGDHQCLVAGFLDDDPLKKKAVIHGVKVLGRVAELVEVVKFYLVNEVIIAMPSAKPKEIKRVVDLCFQAEVGVKILPKLSHLFSQDGSLEIRNIKIEDLLSRDPIKLDLTPVHRFYAAKTVLVTGAAGSIGEEIVRQVAAMRPKIIYLLDQAESPLYFLYLDCQVLFPNVLFVPVLCDITDGAALQAYFTQARPEIVIHAAAYKHVPLLEENIYQALMVNVKATRHLAELSKAFGVERFILISTDKAVNPTNILGVSKRMAELICKSCQNGGKTKYITVRFGNVLGSQGSVIPLFKKQIESGQDITVTHPDIQRYFMMIPEAVQLVLFSSILGSGGEIFVLDMGEQVKIIDLAHNMIRLCGYAPDKDLKIKFTGLRPGEKLYEELYDRTEKILKTDYEKINRAISRGLNPVWRRLSEVFLGM